MALGPDVPPFFTDDDALAADLAAAARRVADPLWRLPFWDPYEPLIEPGIADLDNAPSGGMAGAITAALFLRRFVTASPRYLHLDIYGWTPTAEARPAPRAGPSRPARALLASPGGRYCRDVRPFAARLLPARPDLAAEHLRGRVTADALRRRPADAGDGAAPRHDGDARPRRAERATQLLHGETFIVYESRPDGLAWGQAALDGYVGYVTPPGSGRRSGTGRRVTALWSQVYAEPAARAQVVAELPFLAEIPVTRHHRRLLPGCAAAGYVPRPHLAPVAGDYVAQAERFLGVPYLWGGRSARGLDCSALVQLALLASGRAAPRDTDMQAALLGARARPARTPLRRGDLVFWNGHVGDHARRRDPPPRQRPPHGGGAEPLAAVVARVLAAGGGAITARRRLAAS